MSNVTVRAMMTTPVLSITPNTSLPQIKSLMRARSVRRLPVVDHDRLVGIVTLGDVRNAFPSDATSLSIYELSYLLDKVTAADIMRTDVLTIDVDASLADAARLMLQHKISGLPVMDGTRLVGMITESDLFRALIDGDAPLPQVVPAVTGEQGRSLHRLIV
jgi:CBS domain-containing protein